MSRTPVWSGLGVAALLVAGLASVARGDCEPTWLYGPDQGTPGVNRSVITTITWDPDGVGPQPELLVAGGGFGVAGDVITSNIATWDGVRWQPLGTGVKGGVYALTVYNGDLIAGGYFATAGGVSAARIARWDGSAWQSLGTGMNGSVYALTVYNGDLIAGGGFTIAGGVSVNHIARWDGSEWRPLGSGMGGEDYPSHAAVRALTVYNGELIAGGHFATAGGASVNHVARWDGSEWRPLGGGIAGQEGSGAGIAALTEYRGHLIALGHFATAGTVTTRNIASWDGAGWHPLGGGISITEEGAGAALTVYHGDLYVGGGRMSAPGVDLGLVDLGLIGRWDGSAWRQLEPQLTARRGAHSPEYEIVYALTVYNGELIAGGNLAAAGDVPTSGIARWNGDAWQSLGSGMGGPAMALTQYEDELIAGGLVGRLDFGGFVAGRSAGGWRLLGERGVRSEVAALTVYHGELVGAGGLLAADGTRLAGIARWDGGDWQPLGDGVYGTVNALATYNGELIAGGNFTTAGGVSANHIARWDGSEWRPLGSGMGGEGHVTVNALGVYNGELIAGGSFTTVGDVSANNIARWDGSTWRPLGAGLKRDVYALALYNCEVVAGGGFATAGGVSANHIARWDGSTWQPLGMGINREVYALTVCDGELFAGGDFTTAGDVAANHIARWDGSTWQPLGDGTNGPVLALTTCNGEVTAGGRFNIAGGNVSAYWARWGSPCGGVDDDDDGDDCHGDDGGDLLPPDCGPLPCGAGVLPVMPLALAGLGFMKLRLSACRRRAE